MRKENYATYIRTDVALENILAKWTKSLRMANFSFCPSIFIYHFCHFYPPSRLSFFPTAPFEKSYSQGGERTLMLPWHRVQFEASSIILAIFSEARASIIFKGWLARARSSPSPQPPPSFTKTCGHLEGRELSFGVASPELAHSVDSSCPAGCHATCCQPTASTCVCRQPGSQSHSARPPRTRPLVRPSLSFFLSSVRANVLRMESIRR